MSNVSIDGLADAIMTELKNYSDRVAVDLKEEVIAAAKQCVADVKAAAPKRKKNGGAYRRGWTYRVVWENSDTIRVMIHNATQYRLTHLLENGHAVVRKGKVIGHAEAKPHIRQAEEKANARLEGRAKVVIQG